METLQALPHGRHITDSRQTLALVARAYSLELQLAGRAQAGLCHAAMHLVRCYNGFTEKCPTVLIICVVDYNSQRLRRMLYNHILRNIQNFWQQLPRFRFTYLLIRSSVTRPNKLIFRLSTFKRQLKSHFFQSAFNV